MKICPICQNKNLEKQKIQYTARYANSEVSAPVTVTVCPVCQATFDTEKENNLIKKDLFVKARADSVSQSLSDLEKRISLSDIERAFYLPTKTLSKWKNQSKLPSAAGAALVSLVARFPYLAVIGLKADDAFAEKVLTSALLQKASTNKDIKIRYNSNSCYNELSIVRNKNNYELEKKQSFMKSKEYILGGMYENK